MLSTIARRAAAGKFIPQLKSSPNVVGITPGILTRWAPTLAVWGLAAGAGVTLYASDVPKFKNDILKRVPVLREYFVDRTPDSDKPF